MLNLTCFLLYHCSSYSAFSLRSVNQPVEDRQLHMAAAVNKRLRVGFSNEVRSLVRFVQY